MIKLNCKALDSITGGRPPAPPLPLNLARKIDAILDKHAEDSPLDVYLDRKYHV